MGKFIDLTGMRFDRLTVVKRIENRVTPSGQCKPMFECVCDCGNRVNVCGADLRSGHSRSCGCIQKEIVSSRSFVHGMKHTKLYETWIDMKKRCFNQKAQYYPIYGGRGITVCDEWKNDFQSFCVWAIANGYSDGLTIDRIDVNGNYEPLNCRWSTPKEQANNTRRNVMITYNEKTQTLAQWADETGVNYHTLWARIYTYKWDIDRAIGTSGKNGDGNRKSAETSL